MCVEEDNICLLQSSATTLANIETSAQTLPKISERLFPIGVIFGVLGMSCLKPAFDSRVSFEGKPEGLKMEERNYENKRRSLSGHRTSKSSSLLSYVKRCLQLAPDLYSTY